MLSSLVMYSHINRAISAVVSFFILFFWAQNAEICLRSLRLVVPAGTNKLQTCFSVSNSTFRWPPLCDTGRIIILTATKMPPQSWHWRNFSCLYVSHLYQASLRLRLTPNAQIWRRDHTFDDCTVFCVCSLWERRESLTPWSWLQVFVRWKLLLSNKKSQPAIELLC